MSEFRYEIELFEPLIRFLLRSRRVNSDTIAYSEFPWHGRRVDFVTLTKSLRTTSYELKLADNFRAVEQAVQNSHTFDRSYAVTATKPSGQVLEFAEKFGVGIIHITENRVRMVLKPSDIGIEQPARARLLRGLRAKGERINV